MTITLTPEESLNYFHSALCNGLGYIHGHGIILTVNPIDYDKAKAQLENPCLEDIYIQILKDGNTLNFIDLEALEGKEVTLQMVYDRVVLTPTDHLMDMANENSDAITADCILQSVIYGEVIFG